MKFIYGQETYFIEQKVKQIINQKPSDIHIFDETDSLEEIIMDIQTVSLFFDKKTILLKNIKAFSNDKEALQIVETLTKSLQNVELIFQFNSSKISKKNPLVTFLLKKAEVFEFKALKNNDMVLFIKEQVANASAIISKEAVLQMVSHLPSDVSIVNLELNKILQQTKNIDKQVVNQSVTKYSENDYFALTNAILSGDKKALIKAYQNQIQQGDDPVFIISQIGSIFTLAFYINVFIKQGLTNNQIAQKIGIHVFRVKNVAKLTSLYSSSKIENFIKELKSLDQKIKSGLIDKNLALDQFVLKLLS